MPLVTDLFDGLDLKVTLRLVIVDPGEYLRRPLKRVGDAVALHFVDDHIQRVEKRLDGVCEHVVAVAQLVHLGLPSFAELGASPLDRGKRGRQVQQRRLWGREGEEAGLCRRAMRVQRFACCARPTAIIVAEHHVQVLNTQRHLTVSNY
jgi:hypothetical protein